MTLDQAKRLADEAVQCHCGEWHPVDLKRVPMVATCACGREVRVAGEFASSNKERCARMLKRKCSECGGRAVNAWFGLLVGFVIGALFIVAVAL